MAWRRLGRVYRPDHPHPQLCTHGMLPTAVLIENDVVRLYFSGRDAANRSSIGSLLLRVGEPPEIMDIMPAPLLTPGARGAFDDAGVNVACLVCNPAGDDRLYYLGWNVGGSVPWHNSIGLALGDARQGRFERYSQGPLMDRDPVDPFSLSVPWVLRLGPKDWRMWYGSNLFWGPGYQDMRYVMRCARSDDGVLWRRKAAAVLCPQREEITIARPNVLWNKKGAEMWFCTRDAGAYRIGYARSQDGETWVRDDSAVGLVPQNDGWEGGSMAYPCVFDADGRRWMLYNGVGYGRTGFGLAVWEE